MRTEENIRTEGAELLDKIAAFIKRFVFVPSDQAALALALYVVHSWAHDAAYATPYLYLHSPEKQSGKTRALEVLSLLVKNPMMAASLTDAVLFRAIEMFDPTLILDEVDTIFHGAKNESMRAVLNSGYRYSGHVWRVVKGDPEKFNTYCCKILAGINNGALPDTIRDRAIPIRMRRKPKDHTIEPFYLRDIRGSRELEEILDGIERWVKKHHDALLRTRVRPQEEISDRQWEISEPLVVIAAIMEIEDDAREALVTLFETGAEQQGVSPAQQLLIDIRDAFDVDRMPKISTRDLLERLSKAGNKGINAKLLAVLLAPYGCHPKQMRAGNTVSRGYSREDFEPIWDSYL